MKKIISFIMVLALVLSVSSVAMAAGTVVDISNEDELIAALGTNFSSMTGDITININADINMNGKSWTSQQIGHNQKIVINGNNRTITGLTNMLFTGSWGGVSSLTVKDLTLQNANIVVDKDDTSGTTAVGAFMGSPGALENIRFINCHLLDSHVEGGHWTGGFSGTADGYNGSDGPVFLNLTYENCSVKNSTIQGKGSVGGIIGHAARNPWTKVEIIGVTVEGNEIKSLGSSTNKAGDILGTVGDTGRETTANGVAKAGGVFVDGTAKDNDTISGGEVINRIYGRFGSPKSKLSITGGNYDTTREENSYSDTNDSTLVLASVGEALFAGEVDPNAPAPAPAKPCDSIKVTYNGGNSFSTSKSAVPTSVEIDGVEVPFTGNGKSFTVSCIDPSAEWVTVRWNSTSVTVNFKPDASVVCAEVAIPKTGDMPVWAAVAAFFGF